MNKIIFISNSLADMKNVKEFAKKNRYQQEYYSSEEWRGANTKKARSRHLMSVLPSLGKGFSSTTLDELKIEAIKKALLMNRGNARQAAEDLQISRATLYRKVKELKIDLESIRFSAEEREYRPVLKKAA